MNIANLIASDRVVALTELRSKKRALEELSQRLATAAPFLTEADVFTSLISREKLGSTGLGQGVAIPHGRMHGLDDSVGAFLRLDQGLDYEASDGVKVDLIFALLVPEECNDEHLQTLAALAAMFTDESFCAQIRNAADNQSLHRLLAGYAPSGPVSRAG